MSFSIQRGTATIAAEAASTTATITAVVTANTLVFASYSRNNSDPQYTAVTAQLTNTTTITFTIAVAAGSVGIEINWIAWEDTNLTVQRGSNTVGATPTAVTLTAVTLAKAFIVKTQRINGGVYSADDWVEATLTSTTNMNLEINSANVNAVIEWQVAEYSACAVQRGNVSFITTDTSKTATLSAFTVNKAWLMITFRQDSALAADIGEKMWRGVVTNTTTLTFDRDNQGGAGSLSYELIEFTDDTAVQQIAVAFTGTDTTVDDTISAVTIANTFVTSAGHQNCGGKTPYAVSDIPGIGMATFELFDTTTLRSVRANSGSVTCDIEVCVIELSAAAGIGADEMMAARQRGGTQPVHMATKILAY